MCNCSAKESEHNPKQRSCLKAPSSCLMISKKLSEDAMQWHEGEES